MAGLAVKTLAGRPVELNEGELKEFKASLRGAVITPQDAEYDTARQVWNGNADKRPAVITRCNGVADVIKAVNFARERNLLVSVRGGGHSFAGACVANDGLVIDLSGMRSVRVDPTRRTARAEGGAKWLDFDTATQAVGLACTGGTNPDTGIGGLTLGGGQGWLGGKHGLTLDNLLSVDIVTADGQLRVASASENADLFWAVRGGGGNFGVVTSFEYQVHPVGQLLSGMMVWPVEMARDVFRRWRDLMSAAPDPLTSFFGMLVSPVGHKVCAVIPCYNGPIAEGEKTIMPLRKFGPPIADHVGPMPYLQVQAMLEAATPPGLQYYEKAHMMREVKDEAIDVMVESFHRSTAMVPLILMQHVGNAVAKVPADATAYSHRDALFNALVIPIWQDRGESEIHYKWARETWTALQPYGTGGMYLNNIGSEEDDGVPAVRAAYGANYPRLAQLKKKYDPANLFRHNQNIKPAP